MPSLAFDPEETIQWEQTHPRTISPEKWKQFEGYALRSSPPSVWTSTPPAP